MAGPISKSWNAFMTVLPRLTASSLTSRKRISAIINGLRASVAFSYGSHDEWNIVRTINAKRTAKRDGDDAFGIAKQIAVMFNGTGVAPGLFDASNATGNEGQCPLPRK